MPLFFNSDYILSIRLVPIYIALFFIIGFQIPFWPVWLTYKGLSLEQVGMVLAAPIWIKVVFTPLVTSIADHYGKRKLPLVILTFLSLALYQLYFVADGFWQILLIAAVVGVFFSSFTPLMDNLVLTLARTRSIDYARIRLWGSVAFIVAAIGGGEYFGDRSPDLIPILISFSILFLFLSSLLLPEVTIPRVAGSERGLRRLLANRSFLAFLVMGGLVQASHAVLYSSGTLQWQGQGISDLTIGILWAEGVVVEILLFAFAKKLFWNFTPVALLILGAAAGCLRWSVMGFAPGLEVLSVIQILHGLSFAAAHLGAMRFITEHVPLEISARAQGLYSAVSIGLIMGGGMFVSGYLYELFGPLAYFAMALFCLLSLLIGMYLWRRPDITVQ